MKETALASLVVLLVVMFWPAMVSEGVEEKGTGKIEFTRIPPFGTNEDLCGQVLGVDPSGYDVAVYIYVSGWWTKPTWAESLTPINNDGSWACDITTGGRDECATKIIAFLVPKATVPPLGTAQQCLPSELYRYPYVQAIRYRKIRFAGYDWLVKRHCERAGPGPNYFSDSSENVWVDEDGYLHLRIVKKDDKWYCSEVIADSSMKYGTYVFTVEGRVDLLDENIVLGLFTWEDCVAEYNYREIDIEVSRWGDPCNPDNAQFVVQPWNNAGNMLRFNIDLRRRPEKTTTHVFTWNQHKVYFRSYYGDFSLKPSVQDTIACWDYTCNDIPPAGQENPRINFWLMNGQPPMNRQNVEVIIKRFQFIPDIGFNDLKDLVEDWLP
jgi:hypothetical protein